MEDTYSIVRFYQDGGNEVIYEGLTLEEAQDHCNDPETAGPDWFDGFRAE